MDTILIILGVVAVAAGVIYYFIKSGKIADSDGDLIPDVVEDAIDDAKELVEDVKATAKEVKKRAKRVKEELGDVTEAVKDVVEQTKDVVSAAKGKARKGRKTSKVTKAQLRVMDKEELVSLAKREFNKDLDVSLTKTNLINKVYELYNK